jgi:hypothetical protein
MTRTKMITDQQELYRFLATPGIEVAAVVFVSDDFVCASLWYIVEEKVPNLRHTNEVIGAYVTAGARIQLCQYFDWFQERALYCDTDSVIYIQPNDQPSLLEKGDSLGSMTSELKPGLMLTGSSIPRQPTARLCVRSEE